MDPGSPLRSGRGDGCALRSSFLLAPTGSGSLFRAYPARAPAPARARVGAGAVRAPDCAREAEGARLPSASHGFSEIAPLGRAAPGDAAPDPLPRGPSYHNPPDVKIKTRTKVKIIRFFSFFATLEGDCLPPRPRSPAAPNTDRETPPNAGQGHALFDFTGAVPDTITRRAALPPGHGAEDKGPKSVRKFSLQKPDGRKSRRYRSRIPPRRGP